MIQKCGANCVYRFFRTLQLTFARRWQSNCDSDSDVDSDVAVDSGRAIEQLSMRANIVARSDEAASSIATPTPAPRLRLRLGLPHTQLAARSSQLGDFRININLCAQLKP